MSSGRTSPALFGCQTTKGEPAGEYVVKLSGNMDLGHAGLLFELLGSLLAAHFQIMHPDPAFVELSTEMAQLIGDRYPEHRRKMLTSVGLNFGTKHLTDVSIWPIGRPLPDAMARAATEIFAFDAMIQNDDRRFRNPNVFSRGDELIIFDHELAFSFLRMIGPSGVPWVLKGRRSLDDHVFYLNLKGRQLDLVRFTQNLSSLSEQNMESMIAKVPGEWRESCLALISAHLKEVRDHASEFVEQVKRRLV
jgi:hypothetical protein